MGGSGFEETPAPSKPKKGLSLGGLFKKIVPRPPIESSITPTPANKPLSPLEHVSPPPEMKKYALNLLEALRKIPSDPEQSSGPRHIINPSPPTNEREPTSPVPRKRVRFKEEKKQSANRQRLKTGELGHKHLNSRPEIPGDGTEITPKKFGYHLRAIPGSPGSAMMDRYIVSVGPDEGCGVPPTFEVSRKNHHDTSREQSLAVSSSVVRGKQLPAVPSLELPAIPSPPTSLSALLTLSTLPRAEVSNEDTSEGESAPQSASIDSHDATGTPVAESACKRLIEHAFAPHELPSLIDEVFPDKDSTEIIDCLSVDDAQMLINVIDEILEMPDLLPWLRKKYLRLLYRTCGHHARLPSALAVPVSYDRTGDALYRGGYADVWKGKCRSQDVAVKVIRTYSTDELEKIINTFCKEVVAWRFLRHPNVLPLTGVLMSKNRFAMVSKWMVNGNINQFIKAHPEADRFRLLAGVAEGLIYLHDNEMVHGDLKGANILIDETGHPRLADFGLLTIISDPANFFSSSSYSQGGTARWMSPELIDPEKFGLEKSRRTISSDCYALGMVIYETISGNLPFYEHADLTVFTKVMAGKHPDREAGFPRHLWKMLERCWTSHPDKRPSIGDVLRCLREA